MTKVIKNGWDLDIDFPLVGREDKPTRNGLTMVLDKGLGLLATEDMLNLTAEYIDIFKLSFGTSALYSNKLLKKKIDLVRSYNLEVYPGGTFLEIAIVQNAWEEYLYQAQELGFTAIEISDGTITLPMDLRSEIIRKAKELNFIVYAEIGKKDKSKGFEIEPMIEQLKSDLSDGADKVIVEARESGKGVSIYDETGKADEVKLKKLLLEAPHPTDIIWEAPLKKQQLYFINLLGNNVNLGNINTNDILALESLRTGLRGDTFKNTLTTEYKEDNIIKLDI